MYGKTSMTRMAVWSGLMLICVNLGGGVSSCAQSSAGEKGAEVDLAGASSDVKNFSNAFLVNLESALKAINIPADTIAAILADIRSSVSGLGLADDEHVGNFLSRVATVLSAHLPAAVAQVLTTSVAGFTATDFSALASAVSVASQAMIGRSETPDFMQVISYLQARYWSVDSLDGVLAGVAQSDNGVCPAADQTTVVVALAPSRHPPVEGIDGDPDGTIWKCFNFGPCGFGPRVGSGTAYPDVNYWVTCDNGDRYQLTFEYPYETSYDCNSSEDRVELLNFLRTNIPERKAQFCAEASGGTSGSNATGGSESSSGGDESGGSSNGGSSGSACLAGSCAANTPDGFVGSGE